MLLGDLIAGLQDENAVNEMLLSLGDLGLVARVAAVAAENDLSAGDFAMESVGRFVNRAGDDEWLTLLGRLSRTDDPGRAFLRHVLSRAAPG